MAFDLAFPEPTPDYMLSVLRADLRNLWSSGPRVKASDFSLARVWVKTQQQSTLEMKLAFQGFAIMFNSTMPKEGIGS